MLPNNDISINIYVFQGQKAHIKFPSFATFEHLKLEIYNRFHIRPSKQIVSGWHINPETDDTVLQLCIKQDNSHLLVVNSEQKMEVKEHTLTFFLIYNDRESILQLFEYDTIDTLKGGIQQIFNIPPHEQIIDGWTTTPKSDNTILQVCAELNNITCLVIRKKEININDFEMDAMDEEDAVELAASTSFIDKFLNTTTVDSSINFRSCKLRDGIIEACLTPLEKRKALMLYLHKEKDSFSSTFCENLRKPDIIEILNRSFFFLGWNIDETKYQDALLKALNSCRDLINLIDIERSKTKAICIVPIKDSVKVLLCLNGNISYGDVFLALSETEKFLLLENDQEKCLTELQEQNGNENDIDSENFQKLMADMLGDRDYDIFEYDQHEYLKKKIAFSLKGPPQSDQGYDIEQMKTVETLYKPILMNSNKFAKYVDTVEIAFIYNCTESLPSEKIARAKKDPDYNPKTDLNPHPIFVLRKCRGSTNPCRVFVDHIGRTYETWEAYIKRNKLPPCEMILPYNGRYEIDETGKIRLERHLSRACGVNTKILQGADCVSTAGGIFSGGIFVMAAIPSVAVAPAALVTGTLVGLGVGVYSITRSAFNLYDRRKHKETMSFANSEARGAYVNIVAGSLGFVGAGATMAVSQLAARGVNIGRGAGALVDVLAVTNIGVSGASIINSGYDVFDQWYNEKQTPTLLTIVQLSSSVLFFGNAVYKFRSCSTIVEETQSRTLQDYQESLRSNRHRKTFTKLLRETVQQNKGNELKGRAEVISAIRNIQNKDDVFAVLTRSNKEMRKNGIKFSAVDGEIRLNDLKIDMQEFMNMNKKETSSFLLQISKSEVSQVEKSSLRTIITNAFSSGPVQDLNISHIDLILNFTIKLLGSCSMDIKSKIISTLAQLLTKLSGSFVKSLDDMFSSYSTKYFALLEMVVKFFSARAATYENQYEMWKTTGDEKYYNHLFEYIDADKMIRVVQLFEKSVTLFYAGGTHRTEYAFKELLTYFYNWFSAQVAQYQEKNETVGKRREHSASKPSEKINCDICGGHYYIPKVQK